MDVTVIIVNYNVRQFLENALVSVRRASQGLSVEILVVDNASTDGSVEMIREKFPEVHLIENPSNLGFAKANNMALRLAKGNYFLLLNPDTILQEDTLVVMKGFFEDHPDAGLAGCKILNPDGTFQLSCRRGFPTPWVAFTKIFGLSSLFPRSRYFGRYNLTFLSPDETYTVDAVSGSFMMFRRSVLEDVGVLDESFFMYGEDLDYCYRVQKAGMGVYYVHSTKIVHFKGESTQRSNVDEIGVFYDAMRIFVHKHFTRSLALRAVLSLGITFRAMTAFLGRAGKPLSVALIDFSFVALAMISGEMLRYGELFHLPEYAYPAAWIVPPAVVVAVLFTLGVYSGNRFSVSRSAFGVIGGFVFISAIVFFAKDFAFSRIVVGIAGAISTLLVPGWRLLFRIAGKVRPDVPGRKSLFGRRTLIVGTGPSAQAIIRKLRTRVHDGYEIVGLVATNRKEVGRRIAGIEVIGSVENAGKVINERRVTEVIFSTDGLSFTDILSVIARSSDRGVNFRLVPTSLEAIVGKARIDELDPIPLVEIDYNIHRVGNRVMKRGFDLLIAMALLVTAYPFVMLLRRGTQPSPNVQEGSSWVRLLPQVFLGRISMVGLPGDPGGSLDRTGPASMNGQASYLGPQGLTGLVQIQSHEGLDPDEVENLKLYYARNQSMILDLEILVKTVLGRKQKKS
jgi:hypothetical protein